MATADNLKIAQQLLATMQQITVQADQQTKAYQAQADLVDALCKAQECYSKLDTNKTRELADLMSGAEEKTNSFSEAINKAAEKGGLLAGKIKGITDRLKKLSVPAEFLNGFKAGLNFSTNLVKGLMRLGGPVMGLMKDLGSIFLSIPGRIIDFFQNAASSGVDPFRVALEEVRKEFGNLEVGTSAAIVSMTKEMNGLGESGLKMSQVFGFGREGLAALLRENLELAKGMGPAFTQFSASLQGAYSELTVLRKSTNLSAESFKSMFLTAQEAGMSTGDAIRNMSKDIARAEKAFGITAKEYGKDLDFMMKETGTFGVMAPKEMLKVSTYARKLGVSMETLKKVVDKTLNFEDAAQQSAKLAEAFNIQIDAIKMMNEQDPTKRLDMLREGFFKAGKNIEQLTVLEKKYLAEQTNMSEEELRFAFAQKNRAMTGAQIDAQMKKAQKTPISQAEAMQTLAKSIERLVHSGEALKGGFLDIFMKGFFGGIKRTKEFRDVVRAVQGAFRQVLFAGREVGKLFVDLFPGIKGILGGLKDIFNPGRFKELRTKVVKEFRDFFTLLQTDPKAGVENFMKNMKKIFFDFFSKGTPAAGKFLDGLKAFFKTIGVIFVQGIKYSLTAMKDVLKAIIGFIKDPSSLTSAAGEVGDGLAGMFKQAFAYLVVELGPVMKELGAAFVELMKTLFDKYIKPHMSKIILGGLAFFLGPALIAGLVRGMIAGLFSAGGIGAIGKGFSKLGSMIGSIFGKKGKDKEGGEEKPKTPEEAAKEAESKSGSMLKAAGSIMAFTAAVSVIMLALIGLAALYEKANIKPQSLLAMTVLFGGVSLIFYGVLKSGMLELLKELGEKIDKQFIKSAAIGLAALGVLLIAIAGIAAIGSAIIGLVNPTSVDTFLKVVTSMTLLFIGLSASMAILFVVGETLIKSGGAIIVPILAGLAGLGLLLMGITAFASQTIKSFVTEMKSAGITPEYAKEVGGILIGFVDIITKLTFAVSALAAGSLLSGIGSVFSFLSGTKNPFDSLTEILDKIKTSVIDIMKELKDMPGDPALLKSKAEVFNVIATGLAALIDPVVKLIGDISDDFFAAGTAAAAERAANSLIDVIKVLAKKDTGVIPTLMKQLNDMITSEMDPAKMKAVAELFTAVATGLAAIMNAVSELISKFDVGFESFASAASAGAGLMAKLEAINKVTGQILPGIRTTVMTMLREMSTLADGINVEGAKAIGGIVATIGTVISSIFTAISKLMDKEGAGGAIDSLNNLISGRSAASLSDERLHQVQTFMVQVSRSLSTMMKNIFDGLSTLVNSVPTDESKIKGLQAVTEMLKVVISIIEPLMKIVSNLADVASKNRATAASLDSMTTFIGTLLTNVTSALGTVFSEKIPELLNKIMNVPVVPGLGAKVSALKGVFDLVAQMGSIISTLTTTRTGGASRALNPFFEVFEPVMIILEHMFVNEFHSKRLKDVIKALGGKGFGDVSVAGTRAKSFSNIFNMIKSMAESIKAITEISGTSLNPERLTTKIGEILIATGSVIDKLTAREISQGKPNPLFNLDKVARLAGIAPVLTSVDRTVKIIADKFEAIAGNASRLDNVRIVGIENIQQMIQAYNNFSVELSRLNMASGNAGPINVALTRFGQALQGARVARIENAAVRAEINVQVRMDAADLVGAFISQSTRRASTGNLVKPAFRFDAFSGAGRRDTTEIG
jgi:hypothetical protein